jgi:hypothetical protein
MDSALAVSPAMASASAAIMEMAYDRLSKQTAEFLKDSAKVVFTGVADLPKARRIGKHSAPSTNPEGLVLQVTLKIRFPT